MSMTLDKEYDVAVQAIRLLTLVLQSVFTILQSSLTYDRHHTSIIDNISFYSFLNGEICLFCLCY